MLRTYQLVQISPDELVVYAHVWYIGLSIAVILLAIAAQSIVRARHAGGTSGLAAPFILMALVLGLESLSHGQMVFNKARNTFIAERTHWYGKTDTTTTTLEDVDHAFINRSGSTSQLCIVLEDSDTAVAIYPLTSASGDVDATNRINGFLKEYWGARVRQSEGTAPDEDDDH